MQFIINRERPEGVKPFNVAVFAYLPNDTTSHQQRLQSLLHLLLTNHPNVQILLFTTEPESEVRYSDIKVFYDKKPLLFFARKLLLHRWAGKAKEADAVWCFGLNSFAQTNKHTLLYLLEGDTKNLQRHQKALQRASVIATTLERERQALLQLVDQKQSNIILLPGVTFKPDPEATTDEIKDYHTGGSEYFLYYGTPKDEAAVILLLKAFSIFKHRQKSNWKLVLLLAGFSQKLVTSLKTYKYRDDVVSMVIDETIDIDSVVVSAYAFVFPNSPEPYGRYLMSALAAGVPIIATAENKEWLHGAALYANADNEKDLAEAMMQVYKDEALHSRLTEATKQRAKAFDPEVVAATLYHALGGPPQ